MTAAQQFAEWGVSVEASGDHVIIQAGSQLEALTPEEAQRFAFYLARAYTDAKWLRRHGVRRGVGPLEAAAIARAER